MEDPGTLATNRENRGSPKGIPAQTEKESGMSKMNMFVGEGFCGPGVNLAHVNLIMGPKDGPAGIGFASSFSPTQGFCPFMVCIAPGVPAKPPTLFLNKAEINGEFHGNATWGACQAGLAKAIGEALVDGTLPAEAGDEWCIITANWVNPSCDDLDAVFNNNYEACKTAIKAALNSLPTKEDVKGALTRISNAFYTPKA